MPDGTCRSCGGELVKCSRCVECRKVIQKICRMCRFTTERELHYECLNLEGELTRNSNIGTVLVTNNSKKDNSYEKDDNLKNTLPKMLLLFAVIGIFVIGVVGTSYFHFQHQPTDNEQYGKSNIVVENLPRANPGINVLSDNNKGVNYMSCLGSANGSYLLIKCPTRHGFVYQEIVDIPADLASKFQSKVFSFRDFAINENADSIKIDYQKKIYSASFITH